MDGAPTQYFAAGSIIGFIVAGRETVETPENAAEEAEDAARVVRGESQPTQHQAQIMPVGRLHPAWRITGGLHRLFHHSGQQI